MVGLGLPGGLLAGLGYAAGLDAGPFRMAGAMLLIGIGLVLMVPALQGRLAGAAAPVGAFFETRFGGLATGGAAGQFGVGLLLGAAVPVLSVTLTGNAALLGRVEWARLAGTWVALLAVVGLASWVGGRALPSATGARRIRDRE